MDIRIKMICSISLTLMMFSCKAQQNIVDKKEEDYVLAYKKTVLFGCLNEATNGEFQNFSKNNNDLGLSVEVAVLFHHEAKEAKKIGKKLSKKIRTIDYDDYEGRKPIYSDCVSFAFNKEIDSIARVQFKKLKK